MSLPAPPTTTFRDMSDAISSTWLRSYWSSRWRYCQSIPWDALELAAAYSIYAGLPSTAPPDALPWISADRQVFRGPNETQDHVVSRLIRWLELARYIGTNTGIMLAVLGHLSPSEPQISCVDNSGVWWTYAASVDPFPPLQLLPTAPTRVATSPSNWNWDGASDPFIGAVGWWRTWIVIQSVAGSPWAAPSATFGSFSYGDGTAYGWAGTQGDVQALRTLPKSQKAAHTWVPNVIVSYSATNFVSSAAPGDPTVPDGHYGHWSKVVASSGHARVYVPARTIGPASYIDGVLL